MPYRKRFRVNEVHSVLDMLECDPNFLTANLYILPPADPDCSDGDSGDEDKGALDNLSRRQLEAEAEVTVWKGNKRVRLFSPDDNDDVTPPTPDPSALQPAPSTLAPAPGSRRRRTASVVKTAGSSSVSNDVTPPIPDPGALQPAPSTSAPAPGSRRRRTASVISTAGSSSANATRSESLHPPDIQQDLTTTATTTAKKRKLENE